MLNMSQDQLASAAEITRKTLAEIEGGRSVPRQGTLNAICAVLEASGVQFLDTAVGVGVLLVTTREAPFG